MLAQNLPKQAIMFVGCLMTFLHVLLCNTYTVWQRQQQINPESHTIYVYAKLSTATTWAHVPTFVTNGWWSAKSKAHGPIHVAAYIYCMISIYQVVMGHRWPYQNWTVVNVTGHKGVYWLPISSQMSNLGNICWKNTNFRQLIIKFYRLRFLRPLVTRCKPKSHMNQHQISS